MKCSSSPLCMICHCNYDGCERDDMFKIIQRFVNQLALLVIVPLSVLLPTTTEGLGSERKTTKRVDKQLQVNHLFWAALLTEHYQV